MGFFAGQILRAASLPQGLVASTVSVSASGAFSSVGLVRDSPGTAVTITNNSSVTKQYIATSTCQFNMGSGTNGLYRVLVTNGAASALSGTLNQVMVTVTGGSGQIVGQADHPFTIAAGGSLTVAAGGLRAAGGGTVCSIVSGTLNVVDLGPT